ncbi:MAG: hypothetical protein ACXW2X_10610 [Thermoanaerobaculia bacterium]
MAANNRSIALAALLTTLILTPRAEATLMRAATFDEKVSNAATIVLGRVVKKESKWDASHRWILTYTTFRIEKSFKGIPSQQEITVVTPGGEVGDVHQDSIGVPDFVPGSDNVVFIRNSAAGPTVLYFDQGAYDVAKSGNDRVVRPAASNAVQVDTQRGVAVASEEPRTVQEFEQAIRGAEKRAILNRMELIKRQHQEAEASKSFSATLLRYKWLIALALVGAAVATWQLLRR